MEAERPNTITRCFRYVTMSLIHQCSDFGLFAVLCHIFLTAVNYNLLVFVLCSYDLVYIVVVIFVDKMEIM